MQATLSFLQQEDRVTSNCAEAWKAIRQFEALFSSMVLGAEVDQRYLEARAECLDQAGRIAVPLHLTASTVGDAILLLDRLVCQRPDMFDQVRSQIVQSQCNAVARLLGMQRCCWTCYAQTCMIR